MQKIEFRKSNGFALIPILFVSAIVIISVFTFNQRSTNEITNTLPTSTAIPTSQPSPSPTQSPTPQASPTLPPKTPAPTPTVKPNVQLQVQTSTSSVWTFDLSTTRVITDTANDGDCGTNCNVLNLQTFVTKNGGSFGINGTYFCPASYAECASKTNSFDFPVFNTRLGRWINGGNLFWNSRSMIYFDGSGGHYLQNANSFSGGLTAGIVNHPGLLQGGNVQIDENQSGLSDKQKAKGTKLGIGLIGQSKVMVMVGKNVTMREFALLFKEKGATDALNLDVGGSLAVYSGGRYIYGPGRDIPNAIIFANK